MAIKECSRCGTSDRYKDTKCKVCSRKSAMERYRKNPERCKKTSRKWKATHRDLARLYNRRTHRSDWAPGEHEKAEAALAAAKYCDVCLSTSPRHKRGWNADHDHKTGRFRGVVCHPCNIALGHVDNYGLNRGVEISSYLERHNAYYLS